MNVMDAKLPELTGNAEQDIVRLYNYCAELRNILAFMLGNLNSKNFNANLLPIIFQNSRIDFSPFEIRQFENGLWIGTKSSAEKKYTPKQGDYGILISDNAVKKVTNGTEADV